MHANRNMFILIWVPSIREHYDSFCSWFLVSLVTYTVRETFLSTLLSLVISLAFPKSGIKLGKQGYLIFWKSQGLLLSLQDLSRGIHYL